MDYSRFRGRSLAELLVTREIDAAIGEIEIDSPDIKPLIPDARNAAFDYFRRTGVYPINHGLVVKNELLKEEPWLADDLLGAFKAAKAIYLKNLAGQHRHIVLGQGRGRQRRRWSATPSRSASRRTARRWRR